MRKMVSSAVAAAMAGMAFAALPAGAQEGQTSLQQQVEKLNAGQEALRQEILAMQKQLQEIRTLLQARPPAAPAQAAAPQPPLPAELTIQGAPMKGSANAPVTIVEFSDFQCPFCGRHFNQTMGLLDKEYISTGKVKYVFRHFPLERIHPQAFKASEAAECAVGQGKFWEMHDRLFANQQLLMPPDLVKHAEAVGLDRAKFASCLTGQTTAKIRGDLTLGAQAGVTATPNFFLGTTIPGGKIKVIRKLNGAVPFATFKAAIDTLLANAPPAE
jgi:protein-disulfide isomerase